MRGSGMQGRQGRGRVAGQDSLVWELQGLTLDLAVQAHDPLIHERTLGRQEQGPQLPHRRPLCRAILCGHSQRR